MMFGVWKPACTLVDLQCSFPPLELEFTDFIEEALERDQRQRGSLSSVPAQPEARQDQVPGGALICGNGSYYLAVCSATAGFELVVLIAGA